MNPSTKDSIINQPGFRGIWQGFFWVVPAHMMVWCTLQGTNISRLWKRIITFKIDISGDRLVLGRVLPLLDGFFSFLIHKILLIHINTGHLSCFTWGYYPIDVLQILIDSPQPTIPIPCLNRIGSHPLIKASMFYFHCSYLWPSNTKNADFLILLDAGLQNLKNKLNKIEDRIHKLSKPLEVAWFHQTKTRQILGCSKKKMFQSQERSFFQGIARQGLPKRKNHSTDLGNKNPSNIFQQQKHMWENSTKKHRGVVGNNTDFPRW